jgi:tartrate-resistant acid phosphatase type 5
MAGDFVMKDITRVFATAALLVCSSCFLRPIDPAALKSRIRPLDTNREVVTFVAMGDMGDGGEPQFKTARAMKQVCDTEGCDFVMGLGDNFYPHGPMSIEDPAFQEKFEDPYGVLGKIDIWMILGNHDWKKGLFKSAQAEIDYTLRSDRWRLPNSHYAIPALPEWLTIYGVDTSLIESGVAAPEQVSAARRNLCGKPGWRLLFGHYPTYSNGAEGNGGQKFVRKQIERVIRKCQVQVYFAGHDHHQEHLELPRYDEIIQGAGGADLSTVNYGDPRQKFAAKEYGFAWVRVTKERLEVRFYDSDANVIYSWERGIRDAR